MLCIGIGVTLFQSHHQNSFGILWIFLELCMSDIHLSCSLSLIPVEFDWLGLSTFYSSQDMKKGSGRAKSYV